MLLIIYLVYVILSSRILVSSIWQWKMKAASLRVLSLFSPFPVTQKNEKRKWQREILRYCFISTKTNQKFSTALCYSFSFASFLLKATACNASYVIVFFKPPHEKLRACLVVLVLAKTYQKVSVFMSRHFYFGRWKTRCRDPAVLLALEWFP